MKLFQQLLVAPAALGLLATGANAAELNINGVSDYAASADQVTSVTQFSDVYPTDWAYQALANLVETYGCVAGYPNGTFRGGRAMTRYEAAALLNACLDRVTEVTDELRRLLAEFETELAILKGRVDGLEARVGELEATQFSTTTKLSGVATFVVGANKYETSNDEDDVYNEYVGGTTFSYDLKLDLDTSFSGKDLLKTRLRAGNFSAPYLATDFQDGPDEDINANSLETAFNSDNNLTVDRLYYQFPVGEFTSIVGARVRQDDMLAMWPSAYTGETVLDFFTYAGAPSAYNLGLGAGVGVTWEGDNGWNASLNYVSRNAERSFVNQDEDEDNCGGFATDCGGGTATAQIGYKGDGWGIAAVYSNTLGADEDNSGATRIPVSTDEVEDETDEAGDNYWSVGLSGYWMPAETGWIPSISAGVGFSEVSDPDPDTEVASWSVGLQWNDAFVAGNTAGFSFGHFPNEYWENDGSYVPDSAMLYELYYKFQVTDNISVTPAVYYSPSITGQDDKPDARGSDLELFGALVKTTFTF